MKVRFAIIGTSKITEQFLKGALQVDDFKLQAIYSRNIEKAKEFGSTYGAVEFYDDIYEMTKSPNIDAVYIASPNALHYSQGIICMNNKKHVLIEKALASNKNEVKEMIETAKRNNVLLMEAMKTTQLPNFKVLMDNIHKIGKVRRYFASFCQYSSRYDKFKAGIIENAFKRELSNGSLMDIGVYCIYPMVALFGMPKEIKGNGIMLSTGVDGEGSAIFKYDDMIGEIQYSKISNSYIPSEIQGEEGSIIINKINSFSEMTIRYRDGSEEKIEIPQKDSDDMYYEVKEFIKLIQNNQRESKINSHNNSYNTMKIMDEIRNQIGLKYDSDLGN